MTLSMRLKLPEHLAELAEVTRGFMPYDEGETLAYFAHKAFLDTKTNNQLGTAVEIGTYCGLSTLYLGYAAQLADALLATVDHHYGSIENSKGWPHHDSQLIDPQTNQLDTLYRFRRTLALSGLSQNIVTIVGNSVTASKILTAPVDIVFIDGGHSHEVAWNDYYAWANRVRHGGILMIHDVFPDPNDGGRPPYEIYQEALTNSFTEVHTQGSLKILRRDSR